MIKIAMMLCLTVLMAAPTPALGKRPKPSPNQRVFLKKMGGFYRNWKRANEIKQSLIWEKARKYDKDFFAVTDNTVTNWKGKVLALRLNSNVVNLIIKMKKTSGSTVMVRQKRIKKGTPQFNQAAEFKENGCIIFSGKVDPNVTDFLGKFTEKMKMSWPGYNIVYTDLKRCR